MPDKKRALLKEVGEDRTPPPIAIGHVTLRVSDVERAAGFYVALGLRVILRREEGEPAAGPVGDFDFMVEDIEAAHAAMASAGVEATAIADDPLAGHLWFEVTDPDGHVLKVFSSHTGGRPV
jgi:catechol 2,3-dioxygenase-like lactoylglutathione lyase family enzyme